jgi:hypothetical protein
MDDTCFLDTPQGSARAITCLPNGSTIVLVSLRIQHDKAYGTKRK